MNDTFGFVKVAAASIDTWVGNPMKNAKQIIDICAQARTEGVNIIVFPELSLTGATCGDLFFQSDLQEQVWKAVNTLLDDINTEMLVIIGLPVKKDGALYNVAAILHEGKIIGMIPKSYPADSFGFSETRWFSMAEDRLSDDFILPENVNVCTANRTIPFSPNIIVESRDHIRIACEIGQDLTALCPPSVAHTVHGAHIVINPAAFPALATQNEYNKKQIEVQSGRCACVYVHACTGRGESTTDAVYVSHKLIADNGTIVKETTEESMFVTAVVDVEHLEHYRSHHKQKTPAFFKQLKYIQIQTLPLSFEVFPDSADARPFLSKKSEQIKFCKEILHLQSRALSERLRKTGIQKCVIGVSGGLDSTLALIVAANTYQELSWNPKNIIGITMPGFGTTQKTKSNAEKLMRILNIRTQTVDICAACKQHLEDIGHPKDVYDVTFENVQARERTQVLMDIANQENALVIGTGNMSELALGWCTYNGDHMSMYAVNAGLPKTLVRTIVETYAKAEPELTEVLHSICETTVSPELLPPDALGNIKQSTEKTIGSYDLHDFFLYHFIYNGFSKSKIRMLASIAFPNIQNELIDQTLEVFYTRFFSQQFKRSCMPDGPKIVPISLSPRGSWQMPSDIRY